MPPVLTKTAIFYRMLVLAIFMLHLVHMGPRKVCLMWWRKSIRFASGTSSELAVKDCCVAIGEHDEACLGRLVDAPLLYGFSISSPVLLPVEAGRLLSLCMLKVGLKV